MDKLETKTFETQLDVLSKRLEEARKGKKLSSDETSLAKATLNAILSTLNTSKDSIANKNKELREKKRAIRASVNEKLLTKEESLEENKKVMFASVSNSVNVKRLEESVMAVKNLISEIDKSAASPELEKLEKGYPSTDAIKAPETANVTTDGAVVKSSLKARAKALYARALTLIKEAENEKNATKKASIVRRATMLEKMGDSLVPASKKDEKDKKKTASVDVKSEIVFAANDRCVLPDGVVGTVKTIEGEKMVVTVAGTDRDTLVSVCRKVASDSAARPIEQAPSAPSQTAPAAPSAPASEAQAPVAPKTMSLKDRIAKAKEVVMASRLKKAEVPAVAKDPKDVKPEIKPEVKPEVKPMDKPVGKSDGSSVMTSETKTLVPSFDAAHGKWMVNVSETETKAFESEEAAKSFISTSSKVRAAEDKIIDSADTSKPEGSAGVASELKGLDQSGKDGGASTKDQKVDPQLSMIGTKDSPKESLADRVKKAAADKIIQSGDTKVPDGTQGVAQTLKGLDQTSKDGGATKSEQKIDPELSVYASKVENLSKELVGKTARLKELESKILADRAVKVGAYTEEQREEQMGILAELYDHDMPEFKAFARLIDSIEKGEKKDTLAGREIKKVKASLEQRPVLVDASAGYISKTLEDGNMFDD